MVESYAVIQCNKGAFTIVSEHGSNKDGAIVKYHQQCANLRNDVSEIDCMVKLVDQKLEVVDGYEEYINHPAKEVS